MSFDKELSLTWETNAVFQHAVSEIDGGYLFFSAKDRNLFHRVDIIGNIFTSGEATSENITDSVHEMK